ncbi:DUF1499 domain-containing protein [Ketobacter alkanivorans]|nr:DUF1499 domain-containing protein [Ketobacter alkanivorans]MCP5019551.1 DUF1499 domain-containing protein [Ketobacter sp.]
MTQIKISKISAMFVLTTSVLIGGCGSNPVARGVIGGNLTDCPSSPNCVSSQAKDEDHLFQAIPYTGSAAQAKDKLLEILDGYPRCTITKNEDNYIRAEFTTAIMRFTDDAEFLIQEDSIQVRSASRVGYSDLGKNRSRMNEIKDALEPCCE